MKPRTKHDGGFTLLEMTITLAIFALGGLSVHQVLRAMDRSRHASNVRMDLDIQGARTMDKLVESLRMADAGDLSSISSTPLWSSSVNFRRNLGFDGTSSTWSEVETVELDPAADSLTWTENQGLPEERTFWRCTDVAPLFAGEVSNLADDNGNGLFDEAGFALSADGDLIWIGLTLVRMDGERRRVERSWTSCIRARN